MATTVTVGSSNVFLKTTISGAIGRSWTARSEAETPPDSNHNYIWLLTEGEYADFELRMKVQTYASSTGNSGIQVRSRYDDEAGWLNGPQVDINPAGPWRCGFIYDQTKGVQVWLWPNVGRPANSKPEYAPEGWKWFHADDQDVWKDVHIICTRHQAAGSGWRWGV